MKVTDKALAAMAVLLMLAVALVPLTDSTESYAAEKDEETVGDDLKPRMVSNGDGTFTFRFPYMENKFGIKPKNIEYGDPSNGSIDIRPMETHFYDGNYSGGVNNVVDDDGSSTGYDKVMSAGINRAVEFGLLYTDHAMETGQEDLMNYGINASTPQNKFFLQGAGGDFKVTLGPETAYRSYVLGNYLAISPMQSVNLLPYAVGDFTGDGSEEIALYMGDCVDFYDYGDDPNDGSDSRVSYNYLTVMLDAQDPYGHGPMLNPVSMTAGDLDGDGVDELVMSVEYSASHGSPYEVSCGKHMTYVYAIDPQSNSCRSSHLYFEHQNTVHGCTEYLDSVMTSVYLHDIDFDGTCELLVGGYMWDNVRLDQYGGDYYKVTPDFTYFTGELYLGLADIGSIGSGNLSPTDYVRLMDDPQGEGDLQASNGPRADYRYGGDTYRHENAGDTSIFLDDGAENDFGYCRSNSWMNWTVPLIALNMDGYGNTATVYFDNCLYRVTTDGFTYDRVLGQGSDDGNGYVGHEQDNNNCCLLGLDKGSVYTRGDDYCLAYEDLFRYMAMDQRAPSSGDRGTYKDDTLWFWDVHYIADGQVNRQECDSSYYVYTEWEEERDPAMCCLLDYDPSDSMRAKYIGSVSTMTDPTILAAVSAIPYDDDLATFLTHGNNDIGETSFAMNYGQDNTKSSEVSTSFSLGGSMETMFLNASVSGGWFEEIGQSHTQSVSLSIEYHTSTDAVALTITPFFVYMYEVFMVKEGQPVMELQCLTEFCEPTSKIMEKDDYTRFILQYNELMSDYTEEINKAAMAVDPSFEPMVFTSLDIIHPFDDHVEGDLGSYPCENPTGTLLHYDDVSYYGFHDAGEQDTVLEVGTSEEASTTGGGMMNMELSTGCFMFVDYGMDFESSSSTSTSDNRGLGFTASLNHGMQSNYYVKDNRGDNLEATEILQQYTMGGNFWITKESSDDRTYLYVGYSVTGHTNGAKLGSLVADKYLGLNSDHDDPFNPTTNDTYMLVKLPGDVRDDQIADYYEMQIEWEDNWYDVDSFTLNMGGQALSLSQTIVTVNDDGTMTYRDADENPSVKGTQLVPEAGEDRYIVLKISGFQPLYDEGYREFDFRIVGYHGMGNHTLEAKWTSCRPVPGYLFNSNLENPILESEYRLGMGTIDIYPEELPRGLSIVIQTVEVSPGIELDVTVHDPDSDKSFYFENVSVDPQGFVMVGVNNDGRGDVPIEVTLLVFAGILVCLGFGWNVLRKL